MNGRKDIDKGVEFRLHPKFNNMVGPNTLVWWAY